MTLTTHTDSCFVWTFAPHFDTINALWHTQIFYLKVTETSPSLR